LADVDGVGFNAADEPPALTTFLKRIRA